MADTPAAAPPPIETLRVHQANERTMLAWQRTGIALMAFGFAIARFGVFLHQVASLNAAGAAMHPPANSLGSTWVGAALVATGMVTSLASTFRYRQVRLAIQRGDVGAPSPLAVYLMGTVITLIGLTMTILLARALGD